MPDCPSCSKSFDSDHGVKVHHKRVHGESISGVNIDCAWCGTTINRRPSRVEEYDNLFCGEDCKNNFHSDYLTGRKRPEHAKKMSELALREDTPLFGERGGENEPNWQGGEQECQNWRSSHEWLQSRRDTIERDGGECQVCGKTENLHVHHIQPVSEGGAKFDTENLITLCPKHHYDKHRTTDRNT